MTRGSKQLRRRIHSVCPEPIESRRLLSVSLNSAGFCNITADNNPNTIVIHYDATKQHVIVSVDGADTDLGDHPIHGFRIDAKAGDDIITFNLPHKARFAAVHNTISGGTGNDKITASLGADRISCGEGNDTVSALAGRDRIYGDAGDDVLNAGAGRDFVSAGAGNDNVAGFTGKDRLYGDAGNDSISGGAHADILDGGTENDLLTGGKGNDALTGSTGDDSLYGNDGDDRLAGNKGNDRCDGAKGSDTLNGGDGDDDLRGGPDFDSFDSDQNDRTDGEEEAKYVSDHAGAVEGGYSLSLGKLDIPIMDASPLEVSPSVGGYAVDLKNYPTPSLSLKDYELTGDRYLSWGRSVSGAYPRM